MGTKAFRSSTITRGVYPKDSYSDSGPAYKHLASQLFDEFGRNVETRQVNGKLEGSLNGKINFGVTFSPAGNGSPAEGRSDTHYFIDTRDKKKKTRDRVNFLHHFFNKYEGPYTPNRT